MSLSTNNFNGQELVDLAKLRIGETYIFGADVPKDNAEWHGRWDCAEFISWVIFQVTGKLYRCNNDSGNPSKVDAYTGYFNDDAHQLGSIVSVDEAASKPGALLLRLASSPLPGHVVICDGRGNTVEAHSHTDGVIAGTISGRRWDMGILVPWINYSSLPTVIVTPPSTTIYRITRPFTQSPKIREIQQALMQAGFDSKGIDGVYGNNTALAVIAFQKKKGLTVDGEVGQKLRLPLILFYSFSSFALCFDIAVQNGGIDQNETARIRNKIEETLPTTQQDLRIIIANVVADNSKREFIEEVRSRKMTFATGISTVHGSKYNIKTWGLDELPVG